MLERTLAGGDAAAAAKREHFLRSIPLGRFAEPEDLVGPVVLLASEAGAFLTGVALPVDGGNLALNAGGGAPWETASVSP